MARRRNGLEGAMLIVVVMIGGIVWIAGKLFDSVSGVTFLAIVVLFIGGIVWFMYQQRKRRIAYLREKYKDETIVQNILQRRFWHGQTAQQLNDALGSPLSIDRKSMATRRREIWKYNSRGKNRYALRITLDDGVVIGWDQKN
jgi:hypothetical protein